MSPISQERVDFIKDRIKVLHSMNLEFINSHTKWPQSTPSIKQRTLDTIQAEKLQLQIELEVLTQHLKEQNANTST